MNLTLPNLFLKACASGMMDYPRLVNLSYHLMQCETIPGAVVEFGCHLGHTAALLKALTNKPMYVYDSFKGLPAKSRHDITAPQFIEGGLKASRGDLLKTFSDAGMDPPIIVEKWFKDVTAADLPGEIAFAHLDSDFHDSMAESLNLIYPRLTRQAMVFIDDAPWTGLPGVKVALDEFLKDKPERNRMRTYRGPRNEVTMHVSFSKA